MVYYYSFYIAFFRYQEIFSFTIPELWTSNKPALKYWRSELVKVLTAAKVNEKFCTRMMCQNSQSMDIGELLADVLTRFIQTRRPCLLDIDIPVHVTCSAQLSLFLQVVQQHHNGEFRLRFHHLYFNYVPSVDVIEDLSGSR